MALQAPFVGLETQLRALVSAVEAAELGERVVALVGGEPGIGRTRRVPEVAARIASPVGGRRATASWSCSGVDSG